MKNIVNSLMIVAAVFLCSCHSQKRIAYFQPDGNSTGAGSSAEAESKVLFEQGDLIAVNVTSISPEASMFFNLPEKKQVSNIPDGFFVDKNGNIELPMIGSIKVAGMNAEAVRDTVKGRLVKYLKDPYVQVKLMNFRVTVLGEVTRPGVMNISNNKISLPEALGMAGDITIFGQRTNVLVVREVNGKKEYNYVNITSRDFFNSPFYYLKQNDIVYVEPRKGKAASARNENLYKIAPTILGVLTLLSVILTRF